MKRYVYYNANIGGTDREVTPEGCGQFTRQQVEYVVKIFRDGRSFSKQGSCFLNAGQPYILYAASRKQSAATSAAEAWCLHAEIREVNPAAFSDKQGALDSFLQFPFASEFDIARGTLPEARDSAPIPPIALSPALLGTIVYGCFARWYNTEKPVYIALPDAGFEKTVLHLLKTVYAAMPYSLRAHSGYITYPDPKTVPPTVSLCLFPESWAKNVTNAASEDIPVLYLEPERCQNAMQTIRSRSRLTIGLNDIVDCIEKEIVSGEGALHSLFSLFYSYVEGNGDLTRFCSLTPGTYGTAFTLLRNWELMKAKQKDAFIREYVKKPDADPQINEMAKRLFLDYLVKENRFAGLLYNRTTTAQNFADYCAAVEPDRFLVDFLPQLETCWNDTFSVFADRCCASHWQILQEWSDAYEQIKMLFLPAYVDAISMKVQQAHVNFVNKERLCIEKKLAEVDKGSLLGFFSACWTIIGNTKFDENRKYVQGFAQTESVSIFRALLSADESIGFANYKALQDEKYAAQQTYATICVQQIETVWSGYANRCMEYREAQKNLVKYFDYISSGRRIAIIRDEWSVHEYLNALFERSKKGWSHKMSAYNQGSGLGANGTDRQNNGNRSSNGDIMGYGILPTERANSPVVGYPTQPPSPPQSFGASQLWGRAAEDWLSLQKDPIPLSYILQNISAKKEPAALLLLYAECNKYSIFGDNALEIQFQGKHGDCRLSMSRAKELLLEIERGKVKIDDAKLTPEEVLFVRALETSDLLNEQQLESLRNKRQFNHDRPTLIERVKANPVYVLLFTVIIIAVILITAFVAKGIHDSKEEQPTLPVAGASANQQQSPPPETTTMVTTTEVVRPQVLYREISMTINNERNLMQELTTAVPQYKEYDINWERTVGTKSIASYNTKNGSCVITATGIGNATFVATDKATGEKLAEFVVTVSPAPNRPGQGVDTDG